MAVTKLTGDRIVFSNAAYLYVTPYVEGSETQIGDTTYDIVDIVGDSLSFTPDDNTVNTKEWEFGDTPLVETTTLGKIQFAATCIDFRNEVMKAIFGWKELGTALIAPNAYKDLYAVVEVGFNGEDTVLVVPKLKLNSKAVISTLKTGTGEGQLAGTAYSVDFAVGEDSESTPMAFVPKDTTYKVGVGDAQKSFKAGKGDDYGIQGA